MTAIGLVTAIVLLAIVFVVLPRALALYASLRGPRVTVCPETNAPAEIELDTKHAALTSAVGPAELRVARCEHWPERAGCNQDCLRDVDEAWAATHGMLTRPQED